MMKSRSLLPLLAAILAFGAAAYCVSWHLISTRVATTLTERLGESAQATGSFQLKRHGFPFTLAFTLEDYSTKRLQMDGRVSAFKLHTPITFSAPVWNPSHVKANLNGLRLSQTVTTANKTPKTYHVHFTEGQAQLSPEGGTLIVDAKHWQIGNAATAPLLSGSVLRYEQLISADDAPATTADNRTRPNLFNGLFSITLEGVTFTHPNTGAQTPFKKVSLQGGVDRLPRQLVLDPSTPLPDLIQAKVRDLAAHNSRIFINALHIESTDLTTRLSGEIRVDSDLRPAGSLTWQANNLPKLAHLLDPTLTDTPTYRLISALAGENALNLTLTVQQGTLAANQIPLATIPPLPKLLLDMLNLAAQPPRP